MKSTLACLLLLTAATPLAAHEAAPITIGEQNHVTWGDETEPREVNVYLPQGYTAGDAAYPVLYVIDGGLQQDFLHVAGTAALNALWGRSQQAIVVGIETRDRRAELIGSKGGAEEQEAFPTAGNSDAFRAFIRDNVKPLVEEHYRTNGTDAVLGESLAGLFIVETWLEEPSLFDAYGAVDPSLWWEDQALARSVAEILQDGAERGPILLTYSNEGPITQEAVEIVAAAAGEGGCLLARPDLTHATAYHVLNPTVMQFLLPTEYEFEAEWGFDVPCAAVANDSQG